jgi:hypothetical protein
MQNNPMHGEGMNPMYADHSASAGGQQPVTDNFAGQFAHAFGQNSERPGVTAKGKNIMAGLAAQNVPPALRHFQDALHRLVDAGNLQGVRDLMAGTPPKHIANADFMNYFKIVLVPLTMQKPVQRMECLREVLRAINLRSALQSRSAPHLRVIDFAIHGRDEHAILEIVHRYAREGREDKIKQALVKIAKIFGAKHMLVSQVQEVVQRTLSKSNTQCAVCMSQTSEDPPYECGACGVTLCHPGRKERCWDFRVTLRPNPHDSGKNCRVPCCLHPKCVRFVADQLCADGGMRDTGDTGDQFDVDEGEVTNFTNPQKK